MHSDSSRADCFPARLVVFAVRAESSGVFEAARVPFLLCGVGKVNAAIALTHELNRYAHASVPMPEVINFGTVGSRIYPPGTLVECCEFVQRDMDARELGFPPYVTPFDDLQARLTFPTVFGNLPMAICGTGDSFVTGSTDCDCGVFDMEAFALAKVCKLLGATLACVKFVSDGADHSSATDWQANVHKAAFEFLRLYNSVTHGH